MAAGRDCWGGGSALRSGARLFGTQLIQLIKGKSPAFFWFLFFLKGTLEDDTSVLCL